MAKKYCLEYGLLEKDEAKKLLQELGGGKRRWFTICLIIQWIIKSEIITFSLKLHIRGLVRLILLFV